MHTKFTFLATLLFSSFSLSALEDSSQPSHFSASELHKYQGKYQLPGFFINASIKDGHLVLLPSGEGQSGFPIFQKNDTEFFTKVNDAIISFQKDKDGNVEYLLWHQGGSTYKGKKLN